MMIGKTSAASFTQSFNIRIRTTESVVVSKWLQHSFFSLWKGKMQYEYLWFLSVWGSVMIANVIQRALNTNKVAVEIHRADSITFHIQKCKKIVKLCRLVGGGSFSFHTQGILAPLRVRGGPKIGFPTQLGSVITFSPKLKHHMH